MRDGSHRKWASRCLLACSPSSLPALAHRPLSAVLLSMCHAQLCVSRPTVHVRVSSMPCMHVRLSHVLLLVTTLRSLVAARAPPCVSAMCPSLSVPIHTHSLDAPLSVALRCVPAFCAVSSVASPPQPTNSDAHHPHRRVTCYTCCCAFVSLLSSVAWHVHSCPSRVSLGSK